MLIARRIGNSWPFLNPGSKEPRHLLVLFEKNASSGEGGGESLKRGRRMCPIRGDCRVRSKLVAIFSPLGEADGLTSLHLKVSSNYLCLEPFLAGIPSVLIFVSKYNHPLLFYPPQTPAAASPKGLPSPSPPFIVSLHFLPGCLPQLTRQGLVFPLP